MANSSDKDEGLSRIFPLIYLALGVLVLWLGSFFIIVLMVPGWEVRGQLGDLFGVVNSLFSGLAFAGVIYTIYLQREELSLQRKELQLTRDELHRAATAQEKSEQALQKQVEALEITARLNALSSIVENSQFLIVGNPVASDRAREEARRLKFLQKLGTLVDQIEGRYH